MKSDLHYTAMIRRPLPTSVWATRTKLAYGLALLLTLTPATAQVLIPPNQLDSTRAAAYERSAVTGLVTAEISQPGIAQHCLRKEFSYDSAGNVVGTLVKNCPAAGATPAATGSAVITPRSDLMPYSAAGENPLGLYPNRHTNAAGHVEQRQHHNAFGQPTRLQDANGLVSQWTYDGLGRKLQATQPDGNKTQWRYDYCAGQAPASGTVAIPAGLAACPASAALRVLEVPTTSAGTANGPASASYLDPQGRPVLVQTQQYASASSTQWTNLVTEYDNLGRIARKSEPHFSGQPIAWTTYTYDDLGRVTLQAKDSPYASGGVARHSTVYNGRSITATNPRGATQTRLKDEDNRTILLTDAQGAQQSYQFDAWGNLAQTKNALGYVTTISYDASGHKARMADPDMGTWAYQHDALGQLRNQTSPKGQTATMVYDSLGRLGTRTEPDLTSRWHYDKTAANTNCATTTTATTQGLLCETSADNGYRRLNQFDSLRRIQQSSTTLDSATAYVSKLAYDTNGRIQSQVWPTGLAASNVYDSLGFLTQMRLAPSNQLVWQRGGNNARGQFTSVTYGNNLQTRHTYEAQTGMLQLHQAGPASAPADNSTIDQRYHYNALGHVEIRHDVVHAAHEIFSYDSLNRLTEQQLTTAPGSTPAALRAVSYRYNAIGNILSNSDVGSYTYGFGTGTGAGSRPHALKSLTGQAGKLANPVYSYDPHGNITNVVASNGAGRTHTWSSFDNPQSLAIKAANGDTAAVTFLYGSDHQRMREVSSQTVAGVASQKTLAILHPDNAGALYFERETINTGPQAGKTENRHYLSAEKGAFLLITSTGSLQTNPTATTLASTEQRYWHKDHLGSIVASTKATVSGTTTTATTATIIERLAYEPFGKRRFITGQADPTGTIEAQSTNRGFTGHEHLDSLDFIHMNARVYDPDIGRFLSPDPTVPDGHNPQSFNRYAYAMNNPLNLVDPDGFEPRAADGSFADGGYRGANSGPSGGPNTSSNGTAVAGNAIGANQPSKTDAAPIPGFTGPVPEPEEKPKTGFWAGLSWYDNNIANPMMAVPMVGAALKTPSAIAQGFKALNQVEKVADTAKKAAQLAANKINGKQAEVIAKGLINATDKKVVASQMSIKTSTGLRVADNVTVDAAGKIGLVEVKANNGVRNAAQAAKDAEIATIGGVPVGKNVPAGLAGKNLVADTDVLNVRIK
jgi:RHS repeat-associated protein